jgi:endoglucanase
MKSIDRASGVSSRETVPARVPAGAAQSGRGAPVRLAAVGLSLCVALLAVMYAWVARSTSAAPAAHLAQPVITGCGTAPLRGAAPSLPVVGLQETASVMFRVDQLGYVATCPKRAFAMTRAAVSSRRFQIVSPRGRVLLRGTSQGPVRWNARYLVYSIDFGRLRTPGHYAIVFAGRRSPEVRVAGARALYRPLADSALAFLQSQRDGPEVIAGVMHRQPSHLSDASAAVFQIPSYSGTTLLGRLTPTGERVDVSGGWFDAGDYLKFVETASFTDVALLYTARDYPSGVSNPAALLAEARHGTDWLMKMWDQSRRVLYFQVGIGDGNGASVLGDHDLWRLPQTDDSSHAKPGSPTWYATHRPVFAANAPGQPISPNLAGRVAAAFGLCAQVFAKSDPAYAARCLLDGQTIYDQANTHPGGELLTSVPHAYYTEPEWRDDMELAAVELYLATGAPAQATSGLPHSDANFYLSPAGYWANAYITARGSGEDSLNVYDVSTLADFDLARVLATPQAQNALVHVRGVEVPTDIPSLLKDRHDQLALADRLARRDPFGLANPASPLDTVSHALGYTVQSRLYDTMAASNAFERLAQDQLGWVLGANAWGSSFVVGAGSVFPHCLAAQIANLSGSLSGRGAILRGATVEGPTGVAQLRELSTPEGARLCPRRSASDPFRAQPGHGLGYLDDVRSPSSSEPTDDLAALTLLASTQLAAT